MRSNSARREHETISDLAYASLAAASEAETVQPVLPASQVGIESPARALQVQLEEAVLSSFVTPADEAPYVGLRERTVHRLAVIAAVLLPALAAAWGVS